MFKENFYKAIWFVNDYRNWIDTNVDSKCSKKIFTKRLDLKKSKLLFDIEVIDNIKKKWKSTCETNWSWRSITRSWQFTWQKSITKHFTKIFTTAIFKNINRIHLRLFNMLQRIIINENNNLWKIFAENRVLITAVKKWNEMIKHDKLIKWN